MIKRFSHLFAYLLLVLMPLQGFAAANMLVCNSLMQAEAGKQVAKEMPCHKHAATSSVNHIKQPQNQKSACKSNCATVCANLCALTALVSNVKPSFALNNSQAYDFNQLIYASITQASPQRPPNFFI